MTDSLPKTLKHHIGVTVQDLSVSSGLSLVDTRTQSHPQKDQTSDMERGSNPKFKSRNIQSIFLQFDYFLHFPRKIYENQRKT